jgi:hydrogenase/urease accessory protein HupE
VTSRGSRAWAVLLLALAALLVALPSRAHAIDSVTLSLVETAPGSFWVKWQANSPSLGEVLGRSVTFPAPCQLVGSQLDCGSSGLAGAIEFPGLEGTLAHVMVEIEWLDHTRQLRSLTASEPRLVVYRGAGLGFLWPVAKDYTALGVEHILTGFDHLLFVVALTLLVRGKKPLIVTITAFTAAHSASLAATVLGLVQVASPPVEATIALSIVLVCAEALRPADTLTQRAPWLVAFAFGLLHGLGFASALMQVGLPSAHVPLALLFFNVGVELGQLGVIAAALAAAAVVTRVGLRQTWLRSGLLYGMGSLAAAWSIERAVVVFGG